MEIRKRRSLIGIVQSTAKTEGCEFKGMRKRRSVVRVTLNSHSELALWLEESTSSSDLTNGFPWANIAEEIKKGCVRVAKGRRAKRSPAYEGVALTLAREQELLVTRQRFTNLPMKENSLVLPLT